MNIKKLSLVICVASLPLASQASSVLDPSFNVADANPTITLKAPQASSIVLSNVATDLAPLLAGGETVADVTLDNASGKSFQIGWDLANANVADYSQANFKKTVGPATLKVQINDATGKKGTVYGIQSDGGWYGVSGTDTGVNKFKLVVAEGQTVDPGVYTAILHGNVRY